ncbi:MAG: hypothetical protein NT106_04400 [Candidatus Sumerlaeota bacterium]|nr:hypothetical protein [Candidatus Sumerlaeota bacterium]
MRKDVFYFTRCRTAWWCSPKADCLRRIATLEDGGGGGTIYE